MLMHVELKNKTVRFEKYSVVCFSSLFLTDPDDREVGSGSWEWKSGMGFILQNMKHDTSNLMTNDT